MLVQKSHVAGLISPSTLKFGTESYNIKEFDDLKSRVNKAKDSLDKYYTEKNKLRKESWDTANNYFDIFKFMRKEIKQKFNAKNVTNAWMKYWELYSQYDLIPGATNSTESSSSFRAFFNAELPGAALCAFNHYAATIPKKIKYEWIACSLAPGSATKNDGDALGDFYGLYAKNKDRWLMNDTNDGDATKLENLLDFERRVAPVDLYSHDAGIDVGFVEEGHLGFNDQEKINMKLHLGCAIAGFMTLKKGGSFIAKQYTCFEMLTINLIAIYASMFDKFYLSKPLTSRPYNSEIYLIGIGFRGFDPDIRKILVDKLENFNFDPIMTFETLSKTKAISEINAFAKTVFNAQVSFIERNIALYESNKHALYKLKGIFNKVSAVEIQKWQARYPLRKVDDADQLQSN